MELIRVTTEATQHGIRYKQVGGIEVVRPATINHDGREYYFIAGMYYDLDAPLVQHIFGDTP